MLSPEQTGIYEKAVSAIAASALATSGGNPILYGPNGKPLAPSGSYGIQRTAAKRTGSMKNWVPRRLVSRQQEAMERERIVERSVDLAINDPNAAGAIDTFAYSVIGAGLTPQPMMDRDAFPDMDKETARRIQAQQRNNYKTWAPFADAGRRMSIGQIQFLIDTSMIRSGEYLVLLPMLSDTARPYSLACQVLNPLRLRTPIDKMNKSNIRDGVELGEYGEASAFWIKKSDRNNTMRYMGETSENFMRVPAKKGHRWNVLHGFVCKEPEQVRGMPFFAPAMKMFRDLNDYLDAELVSNIVTAAFSLFIEVGIGDNPIDYANNLTSRTETFTNPDGNAQTERYQEMIPGQIMYGNQGQKPHAIAANRPGTTFEPFTKVIKKAISMGLGIPYPVLFKDVEGVNFAGFRSAMLDAWRVFTTHRQWVGQGFCQPIFTMLQEEAWLRGNLDVEDFYENMYSLTHAEWWGAPKGDIEPVKAVQADVLAINNKIKTRAQAIQEREAGDWRNTFEQLEEENEDLKDRGLNTAPDDTNAILDNASDDDDDEEKTNREDET